jgi:hypothetical protein
MLARLMKRPVDEVSQVVAEAIDQNDLPLANVSFITFLPRIALYSIDVLNPLLWSMAARSRWAKQHFSWQ